MKKNLISLSVLLMLLMGAVLTSCSNDTDMENFDFKSPRDADYSGAQLSFTFNDQEVAEVGKISIQSVPFGERYNFVGPADDGIAPDEMLYISTIHIYDFPEPGEVFGFNTVSTVKGFKGSETIRFADYRFEGTFTGPVMPGQGERGLILKLWKEED